MEWRTDVDSIIVVGFFVAFKFHYCLDICISITQERREEGGPEVMWELRKH